MPGDCGARLTENQYNRGRPEVFARPTAVQTQSALEPSARAHERLCNEGKHIEVSKKKQARFAEKFRLGWGWG
jgi:hypothetical protein